jgi:hypothetical protein
MVTTGRGAGRFTRLWHRVKHSNCALVRARDRVIYKWIVAGFVNCELEYCPVTGSNLESLHAA